MRTKAELMKAWKEASEKPDYIEVGRGVWVVSGAGLKKDGIEDVNGEPIRKVDDDEMFISTDTGEICPLYECQDLIDELELTDNLLEENRFYDIVFEYVANGETAFKGYDQTIDQSVDLDLTEGLKRCVIETAAEVERTLDQEDEDGEGTPLCDAIVAEAFADYEKKTEGIR